MRFKVKPATISGAIVLTIGVFFTVFQVEQIRINESNNKIIALQELTSITEGIDRNLNMSLQYAEFFEYIIKKNPDISESSLREYAELVLENNKLIESVSIAKGGIVTNIYPLEGNEEALGHDLLENLESDSYIARAIESDIAVTEGPIMAKQGGFMIFNRKAIFIDEEGEDKLWGLSSIAIRFDQILSAYGLNAESDRYLLALRVIDGDESGSFLWGNTEIMEGHAVTTEIYLPGEVWQFGIYPKGGWNENSDVYRKLRYLFIISEIFMFFLIYWYISHYQDIRREARRDPLTGSLNKRSFERYVKARLKEDDRHHALILIDLNKFKEVNDTLGHQAGDMVLKRTSERVDGILRKSDRLSRIGGDEFAVFIYDIVSRENALEICNRIDTVMGEPISIDGRFLCIGGSIGSAISNIDGNSYEELYRVADANMYEKKFSHKT